MTGCLINAVDSDRSSAKGAELADVFNAHAKTYCERYKIPLQQHKVINSIKQCRTAALGGHIQECDHCGISAPRYNSCRNRHCPKCQSLAKAKWLAAKENELLPVEYFHVVFTLPHELNELAQFNDKLIYRLLFQSGWHAISTLGRDSKRYNGEMGMLAILHTWGQNLGKHIHIHCVVPGGAWQHQSQQWKSAKKGFLFPVRALSRIFKGKYVSLLRELFDSDALKFNPKSEVINHKRQVSSFLTSLMKKDWVVYSKKPFDGVKSVLNYLGRYTHRVAISNDRILESNHDNVKFRWRDYARANKIKTMTLEPSEFIRRFLSHTLPKGFTRIRSFGFLANKCKKEKISNIRKSINAPEESGLSAENSKSKDITFIHTLKRLTGIDISVCTHCKKGKMQIAERSAQYYRGPP